MHVTSLVTHGRPRSHTVSPPPPSDLTMVKPCQPRGAASGYTQKRERERRAGLCIFRVIEEISCLLMEADDS
ncbi:hypothetical protein NL676_038157 [Syzygium grande]|nr:hypothetical protein NL676_038157 [Syzygium grande]